MVASDSIVHEKALDFAVRVVNMYKHLYYKDGEKVMSKQVLRSGTSIGANISEALGAESKADFIHKMQIAQKEAHETRYWIELLHRTDYLETTIYHSMLQDTEELLRILTAIINTAKERKSQNYNN